MFDEFGHKDTAWQQHTHTRSAEEQYYSRGTLALTQLLQTLSAQHLQLAGIFSDLLSSFPPNTGAEEIMPEVAATYASFAKYQTAVQDLHSRVQLAKNDLDGWSTVFAKATGTATNKR